MCRRTWANGFYLDASRCDSSPAALLYLKVGFSLEFGSVRGSGQVHDLRSSFNPAVEDDGNYCKKKKKNPHGSSATGRYRLGEERASAPPSPHVLCCTDTSLARQSLGQLMCSRLAHRCLFPFPQNVKLVPFHSVRLFFPFFFLLALQPRHRGLCWLLTPAASQQPACSDGWCAYAGIPCLF